MKILVTGASGFLGGHIAEAAVAAGDDVRALLRPTASLSMDIGAGLVEPVRGDLADPASLVAATAGVDVVIHSAARVTDHGSPAQFHDTNVAGTERLLAAARAGGVSRFVFVSSPSAVMDGGDQLDIDESTPYPATYLNLYSRTKAEAERLVLAANEPGFTTCALRPRGIWGPRDWHGFMPRLIAKLRAGRLPDLSGGRTVLASLCHATNAAHACLLAAASDRAGGRAYFIADAEISDVWTLIAEVAAMYGAAPPTRRVPAGVRDVLVAAIETVWRIPYLRDRHSPPLSRYSVALLTRSSTYDTSAAARDLGYAPVVDQQTGLRQLHEWVDSIGGVDAFTRYAR
ncbi:NAD-dependent epimerase/dehydratase family protein [Krasilnikovia sp. MM14-A1259]|uniref:NAD-dependent epimerase/dehydratase family protein n=1 Tax=Krasilnikovia sp. MM14-A1259 TaxID=3373539 RepID=UPI00380AFC81